MVYPSKQRYDKKTLLKVSIAFNRNTEPELIKLIESKENKAGYIKSLVKQDYKKIGKQDK